MSTSARTLRRGEKGGALLRAQGRRNRGRDGIAAIAGPDMETNIDNYGSMDDTLVCPIGVNCL